MPPLVCTRFGGVGSVIHFGRFVMGKGQLFESAWHFGRAKAMVLQGASSSEIARRFGVSREVALRFIHRILEDPEQARMNPPKRVARQYSPQVRIQAVEAVLGGEPKHEVIERFGIRSVKTLNPWIRKYREGGPQALYNQYAYFPERDEGTDAAKDRRIEQLEAENAYLKALAAGKWSHL